MKLNRKFSGDGTMTETLLDDERREIERIAARLGEERVFNFSDEDHPLTMEERRTRIAQLESSIRRTIDGPREQALEDYLRSGEVRAQTTATDAGGRVLVPQSFVKLFLDALIGGDGIFDAATVVTTGNGSAATLPLDDDSGAASAIVAENADSNTGVDAVFDCIAFGPTPTYRSGRVLGSIELATDSAFNLTGLLAANFGRRHARGIGAAFTATLLTQATLGKTTAAAAAITPDEILDLMASLDSVWAARGSFLMNFATFISIAKVKATGGGAYLAPIGTDPQGRPTLFSRPVFISPSMPAMTAGLKSVAFGDLSRFIRREVANSLSMQVYSERYITAGQYGYESFWRVDGALAKPSNGPIPVRYLAQAGS